MKRRTWYRLIALVLVIVLSVFLFWIGKGHTLLLDNKEVKRDGQKLKPERLVQVIINDRERSKSNLECGAAKDSVAGRGIPLKSKCSTERKM
jgi:hypothetical protein